MNDTMHKAESEYEAIITVISVAVLGGIANFFRGDGPHHMMKIVAAIVTSAFAGLLSYEITTVLGFDIHTQCVIAGIAGYGGGTMLDETFQKIHDFIMKKADDHIKTKD